MPAYINTIELCQYNPNQSLRKLEYLKEHPYSNYNHQLRIHGAGMSLAVEQQKYPESQAVIPTVLKT